MVAVKKENAPNITFVKCSKLNRSQLIAFVFCYMFFCHQNATLLHLAIK